MSFLELQCAPSAFTLTLQYACEACGGYGYVNLSHGQNFIHAMLMLQVGTMLPLQSISLSSHSSLFGRIQSSAGSCPRKGELNCEF